MPGTLFVVATPIGNLEDITARALRVLREVTLIAAEDTRRTAHLLARYAITTPTTSFHEHNESQKSAFVIDRLTRGDDVALVSDAGTPVIADPGVQLVRAAVAAGIRIEPVPGPSAIMAALAVSGFDSSRFAFFGFPPTRSKDRTAWFANVRSTGGTIVFFEAPHRVRRTLAEFQAQVGDCDVVICRELTKVHEESVRGQISTVIEALQSPRGEFTIVAQLGQIVESGLAFAHDSEQRESDALSYFWFMTKTSGLSRRETVSIVARTFRIPQNHLYKLIETHKSWPNDQ